MSVSPIQITFVIDQISLVAERTNIQSIDITHSLTYQYSSSLSSISDSSPSVSRSTSCDRTLYEATFESACSEPPNETLACARACLCRSTGTRCLGRSMMGMAARIERPPNSKNPSHHAETNLGSFRLMSVSEKCHKRIVLGIKAIKYCIVN